MVISKRCKICAVLDVENIPISGEYFGKLLPDLILKITGVELDPRKANGILICQQCAIQVIHTDVIIDKLRNNLQRLKKLSKETKVKTPSKGTTVQVKKSDESKKEVVKSTINSDDTNPQDDSISKTPKKVVRRKSVFPDESLVDKNLHSYQNGDSPNSVQISKFQKFVDDNVTPAEKTPPKTKKRKQESVSIGENVNNGDSLNISGTNAVDSTPYKRKKSDESKKVVVKSSTKLVSNENNLTINSDDTNPQDESISKTPKKVVRRKSVFLDESLVDKDLQLNQNEDYPNSIQVSKFKKFVDDNATPAEKTPPKTKKRKQESVSIDDNVNHGDNLSISGTNAIDSTPQERKNISLYGREESPMDLTIDEQDDNEHNVAGINIKVLNCVICGKKFNHKSSLRDHIETSHMGEKLKQCPHCSSEFRSKQKYESHVFSEKCKNTLHVCQYPKCNKRFKTVHKMELHMQEKHLSQNEFK